jgi:hypothetical protein
MRHEMDFWKTHPRLMIFVALLIILMGAAVICSILAILLKIFKVI